ncbi:hypothetical protein [Jiella pelagia]|uniref:Uncharacterized protein n=1 Tax=Jiella pelagia TaxID=2986949 RepID=A0ABY7BZE9_9HYPH|nr:hypothetical protein [Jiella pelagia]WAP66935.1 hypothetical protein OH818_14840 [Jiella pelagia]
MMKTPIATLAAILAFSPAAFAQDLPKTEINVVGNLGTTTQSRQLETPFWTSEIEKDSNGAITARFRPMNEARPQGLGNVRPALQRRHEHRHRPARPSLRAGSDQ